jgi:hypothetical protein
VVAATAGLAEVTRVTADRSLRREIVAVAT